jgi:hypothetical protein
VQTVARRSWPAGLLGTLALVAVVESVVASRWEVVTDPVAFSWQFSAAAARSEAAGRRALGAGDSLLKHGLIPAVVEATACVRTYNLASAASPIPWTYYILRRAFEAGARPEVLVLDLKPSLLAGGPEFRLRDWPEVLSPREAVELIWTAHSGTFAGELLVAELLPSFRARHDLRDHLGAALRGDRSRLGDLNAVCRRNWTVNAGANVATPRPAFDGSVTETQHREFLSHRFRVHRVNALYVRRTLDLASGRGVRTYIVVPPFAPALLARRGQTGAEVAYTDYLRSLVRHYPGLTVLDARRSRYPAGVFVDPIHLDRRGATALSADVAAVLSDDLGPAHRPRPGRWVELPEYRAPHEPPVIEDVEQSRERLGIAWRP